MLSRVGISQSQLCVQSSLIWLGSQLMAAFRTSVAAHLDFGGEIGAYISLASRRSEIDARR